MSELFKKSNSMIPFDLQMFADGEEQESNEDPSEEEFEDDLPDGTEEESSENQGEEEGQEDTVPLKTYLEIKKQNREMHKKLYEYETKTYSTEALQLKEAKYKRYLEMGVEDNVAQALAEDFFETYLLTTKNKKDSLADIVDSEIEDLARSDEFFSDASSHRDSILLKIKEMEKKGIEIGVEEAYILVTKGRNRAKTFSQNKQNREILENKKTLNNKKLNVDTSSGGVPKQSFKLDKEDKKALAGLQKMQPDKNWDAKKYWETMKT